MIHNNKKDINWINVVKAGSIIAVYFVHCQSYYGLWLGGVNDYIHPFYVNAFFFVSGYLLFRKQLSYPIVEENASAYVIGGGKQLAINSFFRIIVPSVIFATIEYVPKNLIRGYELDMSELFWDTLGGCTYWFTSASVISQIVLLVLFFTRCGTIWLYWIISMIVMAGGMYMAENEINFLGLSHDLWEFKHGLYALPFLTAGGLYWKYETLIQKIMKKKVVALMFIVYLLAFSLFHKDFRVLVSMLDVNWIGYIAGCFSSVLLIQLCKFLPVIKVLTYIGQNSIGFYFMSGAIPVVLSMVASKVQEASNIFGLISVLSISIVFAYIITYLINKYMPWLFDLRILIMCKFN